MKATLVLEALNRALGQRQIEPDQLLIHTDQQSHRATAHQQLLTDHQINCSMSPKGCRWTTQWWRALKHELGLGDDAKTLTSSQQLIRDLANRFALTGRISTAQPLHEREVTAGVLNDNGVFHD